MIKVELAAALKEVNFIELYIVLRVVVLVFVKRAKEKISPGFLWPEYGQLYVPVSPLPVLYLISSFWFPCLILLDSLKKE